MKNLFGDEIEEIVIEEEYKRPSPPSLFDFLKSINQTKEDLRCKVPDLRGYEPFIINKGLGQSKGMVGFANLLNRLHYIPKEQHYLLALYGIPKNNVFSKWAKSKKYEKLKEVCTYLNCSIEKGKEAIDVLGEERILDMITDKGGVKKKTRRKKK